MKRVARAGGWLLASLTLYCILRFWPDRLDFREAANSAKHFIPASRAVFQVNPEPTAIKLPEPPMGSRDETIFSVPQWSVLESGQRVGYSWRESRQTIYHDTEAILEELVFLEPDIVAKLDAYMSLTTLLESSVSLLEPKTLDDELRNRMAVIDVLHGFAMNHALPDIASEARNAIQKRAREPLIMNDLSVELRRIAVAEKADFMNILAQVDPDAALDALTQEANAYLRQLLTTAVNDGLEMTQKRH